MKNINNLQIGKKIFKSRLMLGTGKYKSEQEMIKSLESSLNKTKVFYISLRYHPYVIFRNNLILF